MKEEIIQIIVKEAFQKARVECPTESKAALSNHIADHIIPSARTITRAYERHLEKSSKEGKTSADTINALCNYLGYDSYQDFVETNHLKPGASTPGPKAINIKEAEVKAEQKAGYSEEAVAQKAPFSKQNLILYGGLLILMIGLFVVLVYPDGKADVLKSSARCMTWTGDHYEKITCDTQPYSQYGSPVIPLNKQKLANFKKVKVTRATRFFSEAGGKPLIWYHKLNEKELEYYTAPGLHPTNGATLKKITEHMIMKYVPLHEYKPESFIK